MPLTPSQFKAAKFFVVVILLFLLQTSFGGLLAHYTIHPGSFFIPFVAKLISYELIFAVPNRKYFVSFKRTV